MHKELAIVDAVDLNRYAGTWYEIAKLPNSFEKGLKCITATYILLENGKVQVVNQGVNVCKHNKLQSIKGVAFIPDFDVSKVVLTLQE